MSSKFKLYVWVIFKEFNYLFKQPIYHTFKNIIYDLKSVSNKNWIGKVLGENQYHYRPNNVLDKQIFRGSFEKNELIFLGEVLRAGDVFFDIGANSGLFSIFAASRVAEKGTVFAFEPSHTTFNLLEQNITQNDKNNVILVNAALGEKQQSLSLKIADNGKDAFNSFGKPSVGEVVQEELVDVFSLDGFISLNSDSIVGEGIKELVFLKIDTEGWEYPVLLGARETLTRLHNVICLVEFNDENALPCGYSGKMVVEYLASLGFLLFEITTIGRKAKLVPHKPREIYGYMNLVAFNPSKISKSRINRFL